MKLISCRNISKAYVIGDTETYVLKDISLDIGEGEFVAITGPSGSGKSTLMHILGLLDSPTSGTYELDGQDVSKLSDNQLADIRAHKIGFVFQSFNLLRKATVVRNVVLPLFYTEIPESERYERVRHALIAAGLPEDRWNNLSNQLSGGQMQRVAIARALVNDPRIIFADEPTGNLDTKTGEVVLKTLEDLNRKERRTIILITHEPYVAQRADRIIRIQDGQVVSDEKTHPTLSPITLSANGIRV
jgi:putative ABC transport system ATP-binding protein